MIVKIDADFIKNLKNFIANNPINKSVLKVGDDYKYPCMLSIGNELLWEGHESSDDWITTKEATIASLGLKHKLCTLCGKTLEEEVFYAPDEVYEKYFTFSEMSGNSYSIKVQDGVTLTGEIYLPSSYKSGSVKYITSRAFEECEGITKITIPNSITYIGERAFQDCSGLTNVVFEKDSQLTDIDDYAFCDCTSLTSVVIPDKVTDIGGFAFYDCSSLTSVVIGSGVKTIGGCAFFECDNLANVYYNGNATGWTKLSSSIGILNNPLTEADLYYYATTKPSKEGNYWHWDKDGKPVVWCYHKTVVADAAVDPTCTETGLTEGSHCSDCGEVLVAQEVIPALGHKWSQWELDEATWTWHRECEVCGEHESTQNLLAFVLLGDGTYSVKAGEGVAGDIEIPSRYKGTLVTAIGDNAFLWCDSLTSMVIPNSITAIGERAFYNCKSLNSVEIGDNVTSIGSNAFAGCSNLESIVIPDSVEAVGDYAFYYCDKLTEAEIGDGVTTIGDYAFAYCSALLSVEMCDSVETIGERAFYHCNELASVVIPYGVTYIGHEVFAYCYKLTSVDIPNSVETIGVRAFYYCERLTEVEMPDSVITIDYEAFAYCKKLASVTMTNSVTTIGDNAFYHCNELAGIDIPDNITSIGKFVFAYCYKLTSVAIPIGVTSIGERAFYWCNRLTSMTIPDSVTTIGYEVFAYCSNLTIQLSEGNAAYYVKGGCLIERATGKIIFARATAYVPSEASSIGKGAFSGGYAAPIKIPLSVTVIESSAFIECNDLILLVEATSKPDGWADGWHDGSVMIVWGYNEGSTSCTHYYGIWTSIYAPTCTKFGVMEKTCTICGRTEIDTIPAIGHVLSDWIIDIEPTYEAEGSKHKECTICGEILETATIPKLEDTSIYLITEDGAYLTDEQGRLLII